MTLNGNIIWSPKDKTILLGIVLIALLFMTTRLNEAPVGSNTDDAYYIEMARSIAEGLGPVINTGPDSTLENPDIFPVGFPVLLSPLAKLFPQSLLVLKLVPVLFTILLIPLCLVIPGREADNQTRLMTLALVMLNPWVIAWSGRILSDIVFTVLSIAALLVFSQLIKRTKVPKRNLIIFVILSAMAISVRSVGWAIVASTCFVLLGRKRFIFAAGYFVAVVLVLVPAWMFQNGEISPISSAYWTQMLASGSASLWSLISYNFSHYLAELPVLLIPVFGGPAEAAMSHLGFGFLYFPVAVVIGVALIVLMLSGVIRYWHHFELNSQVQVFSAYLLIYGAVLLNFDGYPSGVQTRLLLPVLPIMAWFLVITIRQAVAKNARNLAVLVFTVMITATFVHNGWRVAKPLRTNIDADGRGFVDLEVGSIWIKNNTAETDVVMVQESLHRHLHFYRDVVSFKDVKTEKELLAKVDQYQVSYIFLGPSVHGIVHQLDETGSRILNMVKRKPEVFVLVESNDDEGVFIYYMNQ